MPVEILAALCLLVGIFPAQTVEPLLAVAASAVLQGPLPEHDLALWHGFNPALWMSVIALAAGSWLYWARRPLFALHDKLAGQRHGRAMFEAVQEGLFSLAGAVTSWLDNRSLQRQAALFIASAIVLGAAGMLLVPAPLTGSRPLLPVDGVSLLAALALMLAALTATVLHRQRLTALIITGAVGLIVALVFVKFSAPDLALTQLAVEVVTIVLLLLALYFLPATTPCDSSRGQRWRDGCLGLGGVDPASGLDCRLFHPAERAGWRRTQRGQCDSGGFSRL